MTGSRLQLKNGIRLLKIPALILTLLTLMIGGLLNAMDRPDTTVLLVDPRKDTYTGVSPEDGRFPEFIISHEPGVFGHAIGGPTNAEKHHSVNAGDRGFQDSEIPVQLFRVYVYPTPPCRSEQEERYRADRGFAAASLGVSFVFVGYVSESYKREPAEQRKSTLCMYRVRSRVDEAHPA